MAAIAWLLDLHQYILSLPITTQVMCCARYISVWFLWVASDRRVSTGVLATSGYLWLPLLPLATSNNKTQCHDIIEILFKVELKTDNISIYIHFIMQTNRRKLHKYSLYNNKSSQSNMICSFICYIYQSGTLFLMVNIQPINTNLFNKTYFTFLKFYFIYNMDRFQI